MKTLVKLFFLAFLGAISFGVHRFIQNPIQIIPYPYEVTENVDEESIAVEGTQILVIGDRLGKNLDTFLPEITKNASKKLNLVKNLSVVNWSADNEGLHRTLHKLKTLKKWPDILIYHGASEEFYEQKFHISDRKKIFKNFKLYRNDKLLSLVIAFPPFSRLVYHPIQRIQLGSLIDENAFIYNPTQKLVQMELSYKIFEKELTELTNLAKANNSTLIVINPPVNIDTHPRLVCESAISRTLQFELDKFAKFIKTGKAQTAFVYLEKYITRASGNARAHYWYGQANKELKDLKKARHHLELATVYDCGTWRANAIIHNIIRKVVREHGGTLIDFHQMLMKNYGKDALFIDDINPQRVYYERLVKILTKKIIDGLEQ